MDEHNDYLGDGVYASFDGYHIRLAVDHHENVVVYLEPSVLDALDRYRDRINQIVKETNEKRET